MPKITASYLYSGLSDYWGGDGRRWDNDAGCVFAFYGGSTTLRDIIEGAVSNFSDGGDFFVDNADVDPWADVSDGDIRAALLECLSEAGRADYESGAVAECSLEYAEVNDLNKCRVCGERVGEPHDDACGIGADYANPRDDDDDEVTVEDYDCGGEDEDYDCCDSPIVVFLLEIEACPDCGEPSGEHTHDDLCDKCNMLHYPA